MILCKNNYKEYMPLRLNQQNQILLTHFLHVFSGNQTIPHQHSLLQLNIFPRKINEYMKRQEEMMNTDPLSNN